MPVGLTSSVLTWREGNGKIFNRELQHLTLHGGFTAFGNKLCLTDDWRDCSCSRIHHQWSDWGCSTGWLGTDKNEPALSLWACGAGWPEDCQWRSHPSAPWLSDARIWRFSGLCWVWGQHPTLHGWLQFEGQREKWICGYCRSVWGGIESGMAFSWCYSGYTTQGWASENNVW